MASRTQESRDLPPLLDDERFTTIRRISGAERTMIQQITRNDPPRGWAAKGIDGPIRPHAMITIEPVNEGSRSRFTFTLEFEGHGLANPWYRWCAGRRAKVLRAAIGISGGCSRATISTGSMGSRTPTTRRHR
jgi:hypothetical protein